MAYTRKTGVYAGTYSSRRGFEDYRSRAEGFRSYRQKLSTEHTSKFEWFAELYSAFGHGPQSQAANDEDFLKLYNAAKRSRWSKGYMTPTDVLLRWLGIKRWDTPYGYGDTP